MKLSLGQFLDYCPDARLEGNRRSAMITGLCHDSRQVRPGDLFVCLDGKRARGEDFLDEARTRGAVAALVHQHRVGTLAADLPLLTAQDTLRTLEGYARRRRSAFSGPCAAITGSVGKTSCKDFLAQILGHGGASVNASLGNQNNEMGLWLTLARIDDNTTHLVIEMGARQLGDIKQLAQLARPGLGLVCAVEAVHLQTFSGLDEIVRAKAELYDSLDAEAAAVVNADIAQARELVQHIRCRRLIVYSSSSERAAERVGLVNAARAELGLAPAEAALFPLKAPTPGRCLISMGGRELELRHSVPAPHNLANLFGAMMCAQALGIKEEEIVAACERLRLPPRRLERRELAGNNLLIDDSYNANPASLLSGIDYALGERRRLWLVVGELAELGEGAEATMAALAEELAARPLERIVCIGDSAGALAKALPQRALRLADSEAALDWLLEQRPEDTCLYVKGSRSARLDELVDAFVKQSPLCSTS